VLDRAKNGVPGDSRALSEVAEGGEQTGSRRKSRSRASVSDDGSVAGLDSDIQNIANSSAGPGF
jgi:hypothetical protein